MVFKKREIKVSVILPVYNDEPYIEQCMECLLNQSLSDIEIICVDDGSTDNSYALMKSYKKHDKRVKIIRQENKGAGGARNAGMHQAIGEYLYFPDSDDITDLNLLLKAYEEAKATDADVVAFKSKRLDVNTGKIEPCTFSLYLDKLPAKRPFNISDVEGNFFRFFMGWAWDKLFRRTFILDTHLQFQEQRTTNDMFFVYMALIKALRISTVDSELYTQRINIKSSLSMTRDKSWECYYFALKRIREELKNTGLYDRYENHYVDYSLHSCLANLNSLPPASYVSMKKRLLDEWFDDLGITAAPSEWFTSSEEYNEYKTII